MADLAVTGSTGALGGRVARALADLGIEQRLVVRDAGRAPRLDGAEVREVPGGYADPAGFREALERWVSIYTAIADGSLDQVSGDVEGVTGRPPLTLGQTIDAHPELLAT